MTITGKLASAALLLAIASPAAAQERLNVIASFSIIGDFAKEVGGDAIELTTLVGPNSDAHVYEPRPADARALAGADVILVNGLDFEGFMTRLIDASGSEGTITVLTDGAKIIEDPAGGHYHYVNGEAIFHAAPHDPHAWQSISNAKVYAGNIAEAFCEADAARCETYRKNAEAYDEKLDALAAEIDIMFEGLPQDRRVAVVTHNAFRYFGDEHGVTFLSPQGVSTEAEASAADVAGLVREMREKNAAAVFAENISDTRLIEQIAQEAGQEVSGTLYSDVLSEEGGSAPSYIDMMTRNAELITSSMKEQ